MTVGELLARVSSRELTEWQAHFILCNEESEQREMVRSAESGAENRRWSR
jgi:hypothetical protein